MMKDLDLIEAENYLKQLLVGMILRSFTLDMFFSLEFYGEYDSEDTSRFPGEITIYLGDWWIGPRELWIQRAAREGVGVQPDEPLLAFELARLRWNGGNTVSDIKLSLNKVTLIFEDGTTIHSIYPEGFDEYSISIREYDRPEEGKLWFEAGPRKIYMLPLNEIEGKEDSEDVRE